MALIKCRFNKNNAKDVGAAIYNECKRLRLESTTIGEIMVLRQYLLMVGW